MSFLNAKISAPLLALGAGLLALSPINLLEKQLNLNNNLDNQGQLESQQVAGKCNFVESGSEHSHFSLIRKDSLSDFFLISCSGETSLEEEQEDNSWIGLFPKSVFNVDIVQGRSVDSQIDISYEINWNTDQVIFKSDRFNSSNLSTTLKSVDPDGEIINLVVNNGVDAKAKNVYIFGEFDDCEIESLF